MEKTQNHMERKSKKTRNILLIIFLLIPALIISFLYMNNQSFKLGTNNILARLPGPIGNYFKNMPTSQEKQLMKSELASYYLSLEPSGAADKLYIIKKDDDKLYQDIIKLMNSLSSSKTTEVIELVRELELRRDLLVSIYDEIQLNMEAAILNEVEKFHSKDLYPIVNEIERRFTQDKDFRNNLTPVFTNLNEDQAVDILFYIDATIRDEILEDLNYGKRSSLENKLLGKETRRTQLGELADLYHGKPIDLVVDEIGNTDKYSMKELAFIYKNMPILKSAEILARIDNEVFLQELLTEIKKEEELLGEESITKEIGKSIDFIKEYNGKVDSLVSIYENMRPDKVAKIAEKMLNQDSTVTILEIQAEPVFKISDTTIMVDVLSRLKNKNLAKIMDNMNDRRAAILTQELAKPIIKSDEILIVEEDLDEDMDKEYYKKIDDLVSVYENIDPEKAAKIVEDMLKNKTSSAIVADILSRIQDRNLSRIMDELEAKDASNLTEMLVR